VIERSARQKVILCQTQSHIPFRYVAPNANARRLTACRFGKIDPREKSRTQINQARVRHRVLSVLARRGVLEREDAEAMGCGPHKLSRERVVP